MRSVFPPVFETKSILMIAAERAKKGWKREGGREGRRMERGPPVAAAEGRES